MAGIPKRLAQVVRSARLPADEALESWVDSKHFDDSCFKASRKFFTGEGLEPEDSDPDYYITSLLEKDPTDSPDEPSAYDIPKLEAHLYYHGTRGRHGPKLIYRTSKDVFPKPVGSHNYIRAIRLLPVYEHPKLGKNDLWATVRSELVELLDQQDIQHSSIDLARFSWVESPETAGKNGDAENRKDKEYHRTEFNSFETLVTSPVTVWIGVLPNTLTSEDAFHSSNGILDLLKKHDICDIEVAYRESVVRDFGGPELFAPVWQLDPLGAVLDPVTTSLSLPIAGLQTLNREGAMGFFFRAGKDLYGVTARHILFPEDQGNKTYSYVGGRRKPVVLMGTKAFDHFYTSIMGHIGDLNAKAGDFEDWVAEGKAKLESGASDTEQVEVRLADHQRKLERSRKAIKEVKKFFMKIRKHWTQPNNRVIGHVVWAPPISVDATHGYTQDVCVIKLDETKFLQNFKGNVLDLGPEIDVGDFFRLIHPRRDEPRDFEYPFDRLFELRGVLSSQDIHIPNNKNDNGSPVRYVIKRGPVTHTTVGCLNGFESHVRRYSPLGTRDSVEAAVYPHGKNLGMYDHEKHLGPFSKRGDSGSVMVDTKGNLVALLTSGAGPTGCSDITYGSPMHWLWEIIKAQYPDANLCLNSDNQA